MKKKFLGITAIIVAALFLLTPISAMSPIPTVKEKTTVSESSFMTGLPSIIPQSEFVITLNENEEVIWTADYVTRDDDIAYITVETTGEVGELEGQMVMPPEPLAWYQWYHVDYKIRAMTWWGWTLFYTHANAWAKFDMQIGRWTELIDLSTGFSFCWRYIREDFDSYTEGLGSKDCVKVTADGYFRDKLIRRYPHIHVWASHEWGQNGNTISGYLDWGD